MVNEDRAVHQAHSIWCLKNADRNAARSGAGGSFPFFGAEGRRNDILQAWAFAKAACPCCCGPCFPAEINDRFVPHYRPGSNGQPRSTSIVVEETGDTHNGAFTFRWTYVNGQGTSDGELAIFWDCDDFIEGDLYELRFWAKGFHHSNNSQAPNPGPPTSEPAPGSFVVPLNEVSSETNASLVSSTIPWVDGDTIRTGGPGNWTWTVPDWREIVMQFHGTNQPIYRGQNTHPSPPGIYAGTPFDDLENLGENPGEDGYSYAAHIMFSFLLNVRSDGEFLLSDFSLTKLS